MSRLNIVQLSKAQTWNTLGYGRKLKPRTVVRAAALRRYIPSEVPSQPIKKGDDGQKMVALQPRAIHTNRSSRAKRAG
jgi:uncharacterized RmlC-like cupin family protein